MTSHFLLRPGRWPRNLVASSKGAALSIVLSTILTGCASSGPDHCCVDPSARSLSVGLNNGVANLTPFQWALWDEAGLLFAPTGGYLYAARRNDEGVLESLPPKISVTFLHSGAPQAVALNAVLAPQEISDEAWRLERRTNGRWIAVSSYEFVGDGFVVEGGEKIVLADFDSVRFSPRNR